MATDGLKENTEPCQKCTGTAEVPEKKCTRKKVMRILGVSLAVLAAVLLLAFIFRDFLIRQSVRNIGTLVVGTKVEMASFSSSLGGKIELKGFKVANPAGYQKPYAFEVDRIFIKIDMSTLTSSEPVVETVEITGVRIDMEQKGLTRNNLTDIQANVERFAGSGKKDEAKKEVSRKEGSEVAPLIKRIALTSMALSFSSSTLKTSLSLPLAPLYLSNIGGKGEPLGETLLEIYGALMTSVNAVAGSVAGGVEFVGNAGKTVGSGLKKGASALTDAGKNVQDGVVSGVKSIGEGVSGLFKKK